MSERGAHVVTFGAQMEGWGPDTADRAALVATCSCGWRHSFIPKVGREAVILEIGLEHVARANAEARDAVAVV